MSTDTDVLNQIVKRFGAAQIGLDGLEDDQSRCFKTVAHVHSRHGQQSATMLLPGMFALKGKQYNLDNHFPFEPVFRRKQPRRLQLKAARQTSKSTSLAASGIARASSIPDFSTLYVTPLYEQIRRFSHNYVRNFIENSPLRNLLMSTKTVNSVLQRTFRNGSAMFFSFAFHDADRTRGVAADSLCTDEIQDLNYDFLEIMQESMSASDWKYELYGGTPKSLDNTVERLWLDTTQSEFVIRCQHGGCNYDNTPTLTHDLLDMIGPYHDDISEKCPGVVCRHCRRPLDPKRFGRWVHAYPDRRWKFLGLHIPQIILPMHYARRQAWDILIGKMSGKGNTSSAAFFNEVCAESYDVGARLVTVTDLRAAAVLPWPNDAERACKNLDRYKFRILAADWGGGGGSLGTTTSRLRGDERRERTSFTVLAVLGMLPDGRIDVIWATRSLRTHAHEWEAKLAVDALRKFRCSHLVHDYNGSGALRETMIVHAGLPLNRIVAIAYQPSARKGLMVYHPAEEDHPRDWYALDKARSLLLTCHLIRSGALRFFAYDYKSGDDAGLLHDFLALIEEKTSGRLGSDVYTIVRNPRMPDDFAQAVNIGTCALFHLNGRWPDLAATARMRMPSEVLRQVSPANVVWPPGI